MIDDISKQFQIALAKLRGEIKNEKHIEVEARFQKFADNAFGTTPLSSSDFYRVKEHMIKKQNTLVPIEEESTDYIHQDIRHTVYKSSSKPDRWISKKNIKNFFINDYGLKIALNVELPIAQPPKNFRHDPARILYRMKWK